MKIECLCFKQNSSDPVRGAVISIYDDNGLYDRKRTDFWGRCTFSRLCPGTYRIAQTSAPSYLIKSSTVHTLRLCCRSRKIGFSNRPKFLPPR